MAQILTVYIRQVWFEKSHGNQNFGFDLFSFGSVRVFKNRNRTEIWFLHIPNVKDSSLGAFYCILTLLPSVAPVFLKRMCTLLPVILVSDKINRPWNCSFSSVWLRVMEMEINATMWAHVAPEEISFFLPYILWRGIISTVEIYD